MLAFLKMAGKKAGEAVIKRAPAARKAGVEVAKAVGEYAAENPGEVASWAAHVAKGRQTAPAAPAYGGPAEAVAAEWGAAEWTLVGVGVVATAAVGYKLYRWWSGPGE